MIVDVFGIEAFLPGSQIDVKPIRDYDIYVDKTMEFKVVKINQEFRNVVVSHKALIEAELEAQKQVIMSKLEKGQILEGTVKNITSYGVFVDLGGVDGLIHITDCRGAVSAIPKRSLRSTRRFRSLSSTSTSRRNALLWVSNSLLRIRGRRSIPNSKSVTKSRAKWSLWPITAHSSK